MALRWPLSQSLVPLFIPGPQNRSINPNHSKNKVTKTPYIHALTHTFAPTAVTSCIYVVSNTSLWCISDSMLKSIYTERFKSHTSDLVCPLRINSYNTQPLAAGRREVTDISEMGFCVVLNLQCNTSVSHNAQLR